MMQATNGNVQSCFKIINTALKLGPRLPSIETARQWGLSSEKICSLTELEITNEARRVSQSGSEYFYLHGKKIPFTMKTGDDAINTVLRSVGSKLRILSGMGRSGKMILLGRAEEEFRDNVQIIIFDEDRIGDSPFGAIAFTGEASRVIVLRGRVRTALSNIKKIASEDVDHPDGLFIKRFHQFLLDKYGIKVDEHSPENEERFIDDSVSNYAEHEFGHIELKRSGKLNHTAFSNVINSGINPLRAVNEILADLAIIQALTREKRENVEKRLFQLIADRLPSQADELNQFVENIRCPCMIKLLLHHVRPDGIDITSLAQDAKKLRQALLDLVDPIARELKTLIIQTQASFFPPNFSLDFQIRTFTADARKIGILEEAIENFVWETVYLNTSNSAAGQILGRNILKFLPSPEAILSLIPPCANEFAAWKKHLGI